MISAELLLNSITKVILVTLSKIIGMKQSYQIYFYFSVSN